MERPVTRGGNLPPKVGHLPFSAALDDLPLFPLQELVLLPGALLPLHIFEPRYRELVQVALASDRTIGVVCIPDPVEMDEQGMPRLAKVAGVGTIVDHSELPSGRYNILLRGRARVSLEELPFVAPYRRARARVIESTDLDVPSAEMASLLAASTAFVTLVRERDASFDFRMPKLSDPGPLADHCAQHLVIDSRDRQRALELTSVSERVAFVTETLVLQQLTLSGGSRSVN